jgi:hypothetical protein
MGCDKSESTSDALILPVACTGELLPPPCALEVAGVKVEGVEVEKAR